MSTLVWADGRRERVPLRGIRYHKVWEDDHRWMETVFELRVDGLYYEAKTLDVTRKMEDASRRIDERRWELIYRYT